MDINNHVDGNMRAASVSGAQSSSSIKSSPSSIVNGPKRQRYILLLLIEYMPEYIRILNVIPCFRAKLYIFNERSVNCDKFFILFASVESPGFNM